MDEDLRLGDGVRIIGGHPFANSTGVVFDLQPKFERVGIFISIFGRAVPVEADIRDVVLEHRLPPPGR